MGAALSLQLQDIKYERCSDRGRLVGLFSSTALVAKLLSVELLQRYMTQIGVTKRIKQGIENATR